MLTISKGSNLDTRRWMACELEKGLATHYREQVISMVSLHIQIMLAKYATNPVVNWKEKDYAIYLVVSLSTKHVVAMVVSTNLINIEQFFSTMIIPKLQNKDVNSQPLLKTDALKFLTTFRYQISKPIALSLMPDLIRSLLSESNVVHSYAAKCIEKILLVKDGRQLRYTFGVEKMGLSWSNEKEISKIMIIIPGEHCNNDRVSPLLDYNMTKNGDTPEFESVSEEGRGFLRIKDWEEVVSAMNSRCGDLRYRKTMKQCRDNIDNLKKRYKAEKSDKGDKAADSTIEHLQHLKVNDTKEEAKNKS
eukprot:Gb_02448 [translate_table: standard]